jgi:hypothetical protein
MLVRPQTGHTHTDSSFENSHVLSSWHYSGKHVNADASGYSRGLGVTSLLSSFHRLSNQTVKTRIVGKGLKARQLSSGRNCGNANVNQLGAEAKPFGGVRGMTMDSSTAVQLIIFHRQNKHFFLHFPHPHQFTLPSQTQRLLDQDTVSLTPLILLVTFS